VRLFGVVLREEKEALGRLVSLECGKILQEGLGEVQEMIDICDFAVGLSRQLYGLTIATERPGHRMMETWHPLGVVGVISAFNFPVAVWAWNACLAFVCGDPVVWKPSEKTPLTAVAVQALFERAVEEVRRGAAGPVGGGAGRAARPDEALVDDGRVALVSATGSTRMGRKSARAWRRGSDGRCSSLAAITACRRARPPTLSLPSGGSHLCRGWTAGDSAARRSGGCSCTRELYESPRSAD
jgi:aldehyde dehydrogenase (NAD+)